MCRGGTGIQKRRREIERGNEKDREIVLPLVCRTLFFLCGAGTHKKNAKERKKRRKEVKTKIFGKKSSKTVDNRDCV